MKFKRKCLISGHAEAIKENWFATSIVCGYDRTETNIFSDSPKEFSFKYVTYADSLNATSKGMTVRYAAI